MRAFLTLLALLGCASFAAAQEETILADFEGALDGGWEKNGDQSSLAFGAEHATRGKSAARVSIRGEYAGLNGARLAAGDWSKFDALKIDLFNPTDEVLSMQVNLRDALSGGSYPNRANLRFSVRPGASTFELNLTGLKATGGRVLDRARIVQCLLMFDAKSPDASVFVDNVRLTKEKVARPEGLFAFDFGTPDSPVFPGFTQVTNRTAYADATGFGWLDTRNLDARDHVTPGALERDWVRGNGTFAVKVPNGKYRVWMLMADSGDWGFYQHWSHRLIKAEGQVACEKRMTRDEFLKSFFANLDVEDLPGQDLFMIYIESRWWPVQFDAEVADGRLDIELAGDPWAALVNAMVVFPLAKKAEGDAWLADLRDRRQKAFYAEHVEVPPPEKPVEPFPNDAEKARGYVVFQRPYSEPVYPTSSPKGGGEEIDRIEVSLARGEFEPITFCVYPFEDLGNVKVAAEIGLPFDRARSVIDVGYVQYKAHRAEFGGTRYQVRPAFIRRKDMVRIDKGVTRRFWLTLEIPEGIPGGVYEGHVTITPERGAKTTLPMTVRVHDFALSESKDHVFSLTGTKPEGLWGWLGGSQDDVWKAFGASWRNQRAHGLSGIQCGADVPMLEKLFATAKPWGFANVFRAGLPTNRFREGVVAEAQKTTAAVIDAAKKNGWGECVFVFLDEPSNGGDATRAEALKLAQALRAGLPGVKLMGDLNSTADDVFYPLLDYAGINNGCDIGPATFDKIRKAGGEPWLVNAGKERFYWGAWFYKVAKEHGVRFKEDYAYQTWHGDPFYDLDAWNSDFCAAYPSPEGDLNAPWFEELREGIDDFRYLWMLDGYVRQVTTSGMPLPDSPGGEAMRFLEDLRKQVNADWRANKPWSSTRLDATRLKAAELISKISAAWTKLPQ